MGADMTKIRLSRLASPLYCLSKQTICTACLIDLVARSIKHNGVPSGLLMQARVENLEAQVAQLQKEKAALAGQLAAAQGQVTVMSQLLQQRDKQLAQAGTAAAGEAARHAASAVVQLRVTPWGSQHVMALCLPSLPMLGPLSGASLCLAPAAC